MSFHLYRINEIYSDASGRLQFIELAVGNANGENQWSGNAAGVAAFALIGGGDGVISCR